MIEKHESCDCPTCHVIDMLEHLDDYHPEEIAEAFSQGLVMILTEVEPYNRALLMMQVLNGIQSGVDFNT